MNMVEVQEQFVVELAYIMSNPWDLIQVHYENSIVDGDPRVVYKAFYYDNEVKHQFGLSGECLTLLSNMSRSQPENGVEKWTWFEFEVDNAGKFVFDFMCGIPPLLERESDLADKYPDIQ